MAARKAAAAGGAGQCPTLKLIMEKGPLSGQINDFKPPSRICIGRLARGNTMPIKDNGISSKHLLIEVDSTGGGWVAKDLNSSNGTFLNDKLLDPSEIASLSEDDVIKIGERTSIRVKFVADAGAIPINTCRIARRNPKRGLRKEVPLEEVHEHSELPLRIENENKLGPGKFEAVDDRKGRGQRGEHRSEEETENMGKVSSTRLNHFDDGISENPILDSVGNKDKNAEATDLKLKKMESVGMSRTRNAKNNHTSSKDLSVDVNKKLEPSVVKGNARVGVRTRSSRNEANFDDPLVDLSILECKRMRKGRRRRNKISVCDEEKLIPTDGASGFDGETHEHGKVTASSSTSGVKENGVGGMGVDLEKMTLGEWFDFMEVYLPSQIIDETEQVISDMRKNAERLHEYMLQQKNAKGGAAMG